MPTLGSNVGIKKTVYKLYHVSFMEKIQNNH